VRETGRVNVNEQKRTRTHSRNLQQKETGTGSRVLGYHRIGGDVETGRAAAVNAVVDVHHHLMIITIIVQIETREYSSKNM
jgi:hypothetical protein